MKEKSTLKSFFGRLLKIAGLKGRSRYAKALSTIFGTCVTIWLVCLTLGLLYELFERPIETFIARNISGESYEDSQRLSPNIFLQKSWRGDYGRIYNYATEKAVLKNVDWVVTSSDHDSLAVYSRKGKRGYINRFTGEIVLPAIYDKAWTFSEGVAAVVKDTELYFIDHEGDIILRNGWEYHKNRDFVFKDGYCAVWNGNGLGVIDSNGTWFINPSYDHIERIENLWIVSKDERYGMLDSDLDVILPVEYEDIRLIGGYIRVQPHLAPQMLYDINGDPINGCVIDDVTNLYYKTGMKYHQKETEYGTNHYSTPILQPASCLRYSVEISDYDYMYGLMDISGKPVTEPIYSGIEAIGPDLYRCSPHGIIINGRGVIIK